MEEEGAGGGGKEWGGKEAGGEKKEEGEERRRRKRGRESGRRGEGRGDCLNVQVSKTLPCNGMGKYFVHGVAAASETLFTSSSVYNPCQSKERCFSWPHPESNGIGIRAQLHSCPTVCYFCKLCLLLHHSLCVMERVFFFPHLYKLSRA